MYGFGSYTNNISRIENLENATLKIAYYTEINGTSGTITKPTGSTILLNQLAGGADALVSTINGTITGDSPKTSGNTLVDVSSFNSDGDFVLTGTPSAYPVGLIYWISIPLSDYSNLNIDNIIEQNMLNGYNVESGMYTPSLTIVSNLDALTSTNIHYLKIGNQVVLSGTFAVDPTGTANSSFRMSLPFTSNFTANSDAHGVIAGMATSTGRTLLANADTTNDEILFSGSTNHTTSVNYSGVVIYTIK